MTPEIDPRRRGGWLRLLPRRFTALDAGVSFRAASLGAGLILLGLTMTLVPRTNAHRIALRLVRAGVETYPFPHPAELAGGQPLCVSAFVEAGWWATLSIDHTPMAGRLHVRSADHVRSFRIPDPDEESLRWARLDPGSRSVRRYIQLALTDTRETSATVVLRVSSRTPAWLGLVALGCLALTARRTAPLWSRARNAWRTSWPAVLAVTVACGTTAWLCVSEKPYRGDLDELLVTEPAIELLRTSDLRLSEFRYPHPQIYWQAIGVGAYTIARGALGGFGYHDPYSNQLIFDGRYGAANPAGPGFIQEYTAETALPWIRRSYAVGVGLLVLLGYLIGARVHSARAGLFAAALLAAQPLLRDSAILPNMPKALIGLLAAYGFLCLSTRPCATLTKGWLAGCALGWKYDPTFVLLLPLALLASGPVQRGKTFALGFVGALAGLLSVYPTLFWNLGTWIAQTTGEAIHYEMVGHSWFSVDQPLAALPYLLRLNRHPGPNLILLAPLLIGAVQLIRRAPGLARLALLGPPIVSILFLSRQMVQFPRNYAMVVAFLCVIAGIGMGAVHSVRDPRLRSAAVAVFGAATLTMILAEMRDEWYPARNARWEAIRWINERGDPGARVILMEPMQRRLEGLIPDQQRFQVRRRDWVPGERSQRPFDFLLVDNDRELRLPEGIRECARFGDSSTQGVYIVYCASRSTQPEAPPDQVWPPPSPRS